MLKIFKDNIESKNPATRLAAVGRLDPANPEDQPTLQRIATDDSDGKVRCAAVAGVTNLLCLSPLLGDTGTAVPATVSEAARARLAQLLADSLYSNTTANARLAAAGSRDACVLIACYAADEASRNAVIIMLDEQTDVARVVCESRFHGTRQAASERLFDEQLMAEVAHTIKDRDKVVARSLQDILGQKQRSVVQANAHQEEINHLISSMQQLSQDVWSPQYAGRFLATHDRWKKLDPGPGSEQQRIFQDYFKVSEQQVEQARNRQMAKDYCSEALRTHITLSKQLKASTLPDLATTVSLVRQQSVNAHAGWRVSVDVATPDPASVKTYDSSHAALHQLLQQAQSLVDLNLHSLVVNEQSLSQCNDLLKAAGTIIGDLDKVEEKGCLFIEDAAVVARQLTSRSKQLHNEDEAKAQSINKQITALGATIRAGKWSPASSLYARVDKKIQRLEGHPGQSVLAAKLLKHKAKLDELADWQNFAAKPKLEALCEEMEKLPAEELKPQAMGERIKSLQEQWKALGASPVANELWDRFKAASDLAYAPVGELRAAQKEERETRHNNKIKACDQLQAFLDNTDWDDADWKLVEKTLRKAKTDWRNNRVQQRKPDRELENRFTTIVTGFNEKLSVQYDANAAVKEELVEKVRKLAESDNNQHVVNETRKLQNTWKQGGIMRRKQDQELWEQFNGACREIYKQHHAAQKEKTESGLQHVKKARELIRAAKELASAAIADDNAFSELQEQFSALPEFPDKDRKFLFRDFNQAVTRFSQLKEKSQNQAAQAEWEELLRKAVLCARFEALVGGADEPAAEPTAELGQALEDLENEWNETEVVLPKPWEKKIFRRKSLALSHIKNTTSYDFTEGERTRRLHCIQAEILSGAETPAQDKQLRMEYQLENLQQGLGSAAVSDKNSELRKLSVEWLYLMPGDPANRERLESRFQAAVKK